MKHWFNNMGIAVFLLLLLSCSENKEKTVPQIIPLPTEVQSGSQSFLWNSSSAIVISEEKPELRKTAEYIQNILNKATGRDTEIKCGTEETDNVLVLRLNSSVASKEGYELDINEKRVLIIGGEPAGIFYGIQTLLQLMPAEVFQQGVSSETITIQGVSIKDSPRFPYRGMHLDVSRNFMTKDEVKKFIDLIAMYKFNRFHWHFTDGVGWRMEIKKYPLLTQKTAFRPTDLTTFWAGDRRFCDEGTPGGIGGYYTQEDIKEVVAYATQRHITIIPEIEMPGHSEEVFVAYPQLSCLGKPYVGGGDFCIGNEETFTFLEDVLSEVIELFPSEYIHIGGDEAGKVQWKTCPKCQDRIKTNNLKDVDELQSYFIRRIDSFVQSKGRKTIGWDEVLEGGMDSKVAIMVWRGEKTGEEAARNGHQIIMSPGRYCYFDSYQADPMSEPEAIGGYLPLERVYGFEPVSDQSVSSSIMGGQGNIWTEYIPTFAHVEYMAFPRALALSEVLWSAPENKNWEGFKYRLQGQEKKLNYLNVNYHKPSYDIQINEKTDSINKRIEITLNSERHQPEIRYTLDGSTPTTKSPLYNGKFYVGEQNTTVCAAIFENGKAIEPHSKKQTGYHLALGKKVIYNSMWESYSAGGETALVDGKRGGFSYSDNLWQGFTRDMEVIIDLEKVTVVNQFNARFMQLTGPDVYMPRYVEVSLSKDGVSYESVLKIENTIPEDHNRLILTNFGGSLGNKPARYIKVFAQKNKGFIFTDELVIF